MWDDGASNSNSSKNLATELKEMRVKYTKLVSRCRKAERQLQNTNNIVANLREENETLRLTPLLVKGGGKTSGARPHSAHGTTRSSSSSSRSKSQSRVIYLEKILQEKDDIIRKLTRERSTIRTREVKAMNEEYIAEISRLRSILYGNQENARGANSFGMMVMTNKLNNANRKSNDAVNKRLIKENKKLARSLMFEKDRYRRYLVSEIQSDKLLDAEMEPLRCGFSMGDVIEAQQTEIEKLNRNIVRLKEKNEVLVGKLGTLNAIQRLNN
eukprot:g1610.t1